MKVKDIKEQLKDLNDDLEVYVYADHGQHCIRCGHVCEEYIPIVEKYDYSVEGSWILNDLIEEGEDINDYVKICVISD